MTSVLSLAPTRTGSWTEETLLGHPFRYSVDQPAPRQWTAIGLLRLPEGYLFLASAGSTEAEALEELRRRFRDRLAALSVTVAALEPPR
ncbi:MAG: hypothetical protein RMK01_03845 [Thermomicrobium sp.]|nr:hypothetical protein [Thermomicrobium sp.]MDW8059185.1 hypothetical protein [Thermomicrobium sp.]